MTDSDPFSSNQVFPNIESLVLEKVRIRNYKSIGNCDVSFGPLTVLVGRNGAGKSNFLDAIRFVVDGLQSTLDHAIRSRGGIDQVRRRSTGHPHNLSISLTLNLSRGRQAIYAFEISAAKAGAFAVKQEELRIMNTHTQCEDWYRVLNGEAKGSPPTMPPASSDRLYLVHVSGLPEFLEVYQKLVSMGFYNMNAESMKEIQSPDAGELLRHDGSNIASVIARLESERPEVMDRMMSYLVSIVNDITNVSHVSVGPKETLEFRQQIKGAAYPWRFYAQSMSDGTLRALGALVAVSQLANYKRYVSFVGIEEPETALHPAAAGALMDALRESVLRTQVSLTTHSPDLLDQLDLANDQLLVVDKVEGNTTIAEVDQASLQAIQRHLYTAGELLRMDQLGADSEDIRRQERQLEFFSGGSNV